MYVYIVHVLVWGLIAWLFSRWRSFLQPGGSELCAAWSIAMRLHVTPLRGTLRCMIDPARDPDYVNRAGVVYVNAKVQLTIWLRRLVYEYGISPPISI